ncbi:ABC transporter permease subunit [Bacillus hwajinpoensis]|jgi:D-methionine transport system permease protein|uniref:ABC transporter permease subunit n=1 Tax=Guptibacillus hwajinpoensis TaxID=208199 RepID=A0A845ERY0_9BACL|nr:MULTISPECIES: methionine ABC transporter permease [Bacillaceae]MYL61750.1 ABC transporter permease subunit [Pseudalkalibacillus hwajinpoensis]PFG14597.1 D-methionine transport system permease protein [Bacillus sp. es.036]QHA93215.1 ABC transporter permease subunit [Bacillus sp. N1-1]
MVESLFPNVNWESMWEATIQTAYMTAISVLATFILGILLGLLLFLTGRGNIWENKFVNSIIAGIVNLFRSIPFIILIILLIPLSVYIIGTMLGANAALPALIAGAAPFYARMVEIALREVDKGVIEASQSMGASNGEIIFKVLLPEAMPALISGITVTAIALVSYTAMAGVVGAGGLGNLAYLEGFQRNNPDVTLVATVLILVIVAILQIAGDLATRVIDKR